MESSNIIQVNLIHLKSSYAKLLKSYDHRQEALENAVVQSLQSNFSNQKKRSLLVRALLVIQAVIKRIIIRLERQS